LREIIARPLTGEAFAAFGDVLEAPPAPGRAHFDRGLGDARPTARADLWVTRVEPLAALPLRATRLERHELSSQSFVPLVVGRWLVVVAPAGADGRPDVAAARAFLAGPGRGITLHANTWHHPLTVLDQAAEFAVLQWRDGTAADEEFVPVEPFLVDVG